MAFLIGEKTVTVDGKNRLRLPTEMRKLLGEKFDGRFVIRKNEILNCLEIFPQFLWEKAIEEKLAKYDVAFGDHQDIIHLMLKGTDFAELDSEGVRITLPADMLKFAKIGEEGTLVGAKDFFGFWNPEQYISYNQGLETRRKQLLEMYSEVNASSGNNIGNGNRPPNQ